MGLRVLYAAGECAPFLKTGGLGDVAGALPAALTAAEPGTEVDVILPWYRTVRERYGDRAERIMEFHILLGWRDQYVGLLALREGSVRYLFVDNAYYFDRDGAYGHFDDGERFAFFSLAVAETMRRLDRIPDLLHVNDWQTALTPLFLRVLAREDARLGAVRTLLTIHNVEYQGRAPMEFAADVLGLSEEDAALLRWDGGVNFLKAGIACADRVNTVSRSYAQELLDPFYAFGLDRILRDEAGKLRGIVNGIDTELYDPARDPALTVRYSASEPSDKEKNRAALRRELGLAARPESPLFIMVTRLVSHKGLELLEQAMPALMEELNIQLAVLGTGESRYEELFRRWAETRPERCAVRLCFDDALARRFYAGADMVLMPSRQEPCGLTQLVAMRYGTVPIVRQTGGLADTVPPWDPETETGLGFVFSDYSAEALLNAVRRACGVFADKKSWAKLRCAVMSADSSWDKSAREYLALYRELL